MNFQRITQWGRTVALMTLVSCLWLPFGSSAHAREVDEHTLTHMGCTESMCPSHLAEPSVSCLTECVSQHPAVTPDPAIAPIQVHTHATPLERARILPPTVDGQQSPIQSTGPPDWTERLLTTQLRE